MSEDFQHLKRAEEMSEEKYIQFAANFDDWVAVKKLKISKHNCPLFSLLLPRTIFHY